MKRQDIETIFFELCFIWRTLHQLRQKYNTDAALDSCDTIKTILEKYLEKQ